MKARVDKTWDFFGKRDPYYAILTERPYHLPDLNEDAKANFFESGSVHMRDVVESINGLTDNPFRPTRGLDFGCGVGRLAIPIASLCGSIVGIDISDHMLEEARANARIEGISNIEFILSDSELSGVSGSFDFINSFLVFQHIPRRRGIGIVRRLINRLDDDGVGVFHFTYYRDGSNLHRLIYVARKFLPFENGLVNLILHRPFRQQMMEMTEYRLNDILRVIQESSCDLSHVDFCVDYLPQETVFGVMIFCQKKESKIWSIGEMGDTI